MKQIRLFIATAIGSLVTSGLMAQTVILDDFETWNGTTPNGWSVSFTPGITPAADAHGGLKAVRIGVADGGSGFNSSGVLVKTFRFTSQPVKTVSFWYKADLVAGDFLTIGGLLVSDTINSCSGSMVGTFDITTNASVYTQKSIGYTYSGACTPNKVRFMDMRLDGTLSASSSYVKIDDISISSVAVGEGSIDAPATQLESVFPNPSRNNRVEIIYSLAQPENVEVNVLDLSGRLIKQLVNVSQVPGRYKALIAHGELPAGVYLCELKTGNGREVKKLVIN